MIETDFLFTVANVGAAFVGFSTLVVVVSQRLSGTRSRLVTARLMGMLRLSLLAIVSCLVPFLPAYAGLPDIVAWRLSSGFFGLGWLIYYVYIVITLRGQGLLPRVSLLNRINLVGVHPSAVLSLMLGAFGLWGERTSLVYLSCILVILYLCGFLFLQQVTAISEETESDDGLQDH